MALGFPILLRLLSAKENGGRIKISAPCSSSDPSLMHLFVLLSAKEMVLLRSGFHGPTELSQSQHSREHGFNRKPHQSAGAPPPVTNITRIMRRAIPANGKIELEAKEFMQECVSEFIGLVTLKANRKSWMESRRTITADDVVAALNILNFDNYAQLSSCYLERYRESQTTWGPQTAALMGQEARGLQTAYQEMHGGSVNPVDKKIHFILFCGISWRLR